MREEFERVYEQASVPGYMDRLCKEIVTRLMAKGITITTIIQNGDNFILQISDYRRRSGVFQVSCINNSTIEWRQYA